MRLRIMITAAFSTGSSGVMARGFFGHDVRDLDLGEQVVELVHVQGGGLDGEALLDVPVRDHAHQPPSSSTTAGGGSCSPS
jgi:hypothetical protein